MINATKEKKSAYSFRRPRYMSEGEYATKILSEYRNAKQHDAKNFDRCLQNNRLYWAVDTDKGLGQIPAGVVAEMIRIGKQPGAYNICRPTVDNIVGGFLQNYSKFDFRPVNEDISSLTYAVRDMIFSESELMDWKATDLEGMIDGCIYRADYQMYIDRSFKDPYISWRILPAGSVTWEPKLSSKHKERRKVFREMELSAMDMLDFFSGSREKIIRSVMYKQYGEEAVKKWAELQEQYGEEYGPNSGVVPFSNNEQMWGSRYKVVMCYHMEKVTRSFEYVLTEDGDRVELPRDLEDPQAKIEWMNQNTPGWIPDAVFSDEETVDIQYMTAVCEALGSNMLICDGPTDVQCGMLEIVPWSAYFKAGEFGGIIDSIKDIQLSLNWIQNTLQYRLHIDGEGTSWFAYPEAFSTPAEYQRWIDCKNKAGETFAMNPAMAAKFPNGPAIPVPKSPYPREASDRLEQLLDKLLPMIGKYTPASRGQSESSSESGYLFNLKKLQNDVERMVLGESRRNFKNLQGEMYLNQVISLRGNKLSVKIFNPSTNKTFEVNKRERETLDTGEEIEYIANDISKLKDIRHRVIITESPDSPTKRAESAQIVSELMNGIKNPQLVPLTITSLTHSLIKVAENLSEDEKMEQEENFRIEEEVAKASAAAQIAMFKLQVFQAEQQMQAPPPTPPMPGAAGAGSVPGGGGVPTGNQQPAGTMQQQPQEAMAMAA